MKRALDLLGAALSAIEAVTIVLLSFGGLAIGTMQVVLRYAFNTGYSWSEAAFILLTVSAMLMAGSRAVREDAHVRVDLLPMLATPRLQQVLQIIAHLATFALCAYFFYAGLKYVQFSKMMDTTSPDTGLKDWVIWLIVPVTMSFFCLRYAIRIILALRGEDIMVAHSIAGDPENVGGRS